VGVGAAVDLDGYCVIAGNSAPAPGRLPAPGHRRSL